MGELSPAAPAASRGVAAWLPWAATACLIAALAAPIVLGAGAAQRGTLAWMSVVGQGLLLATIASNWNVVGGYLGCIDLGHVAYFGLGAYGTGAAMAMLGWGLPAALAAGTGLAAAAASAAGFAILQLRGATFAIATLGVLVAIRETVRVAAPLTGGGRGLTLPALDPAAFYYGAVGVFALAVALSWQLRRTSLWPVLLAIREDEPATAARGVPTMAWKRAVFAAAATVTGAAGGLWAYQSAFIDPDLAFADARSLDMITAALLGGLGTVIGPVVGAGLLFAGRSAAWLQSTPYQVLLLGLVLIGVVRWLPRGIVGAVRGGQAVEAVLAGLSDPARASALARDEASPERPAPGREGRAPKVASRPSSPAAAPDALGAPLLQVRGLRARIEGAAVLDGVDLEVRRGEILGVIGPNGSGKTTLVDCLSRLRAFDEGAIVLAGQRIARQPSRVATSGLARTFQVRRLFSDLSVIDNLLLSARRTLIMARRPVAPPIRRRAESLLAQLGLEAVAETGAGKLPAGQQRLLEIGMALMLDPEVLVLDEATAGVARAGVATVKAVARSCAVRGKGVIVVEHDVGVVADLCHRVVVLDRGRVVAEGTPESVMTSEAIETAYFGTATV